MLGITRRLEDGQLEQGPDLPTVSRPAGKYPMHCHNTVHEDHGMMVLFHVVA
jgi:hypothetical protein